MDTIGFFTSEEKKLFFSKYRLLLRNLYSFLEREDIRKMKELMKRVVALDCYGRDKNGINGLLRNIDTALIATLEIGLKRTSVIALLLYRPVLKKAITIEEVEQKFGADVTLIIRRLLKTSDLYARNTAVNSENFHHLLFSFAEDVRVILLMIADRLCLMRMGKQMQEDDRIRLATEASYLYAPLAHRLGLYTIKSELEDLSLKYTDRKQYDFIKRKLNETKRSRDAYIAEFIAPIKRKLAAAGFKFDIKGRTKSIHSINNKLKKQQVEFEGIYDLFAIRIVLDTPLEKERSECWQVYSIVTDMYQPNPKRMKDWISIPKSNGYESLHITVMGPQNKWVEVQIRTRRMDEIAERGLAAHWKYKGVKAESGLDEFLNTVRAALEAKENNPLDLMQDFKMDLYKDEIYVFTPTGELIKLAKGATVLDFAFAIHTKLGSKCVSAKVNGKNVPIKYTLNNGDSVSVITSPAQSPKRDWLNFVVTSKARVKIKQALKEETVKAVEFAKEMLQRRFKNRKIDMDEPTMMRYIKKKGFKTVTDFYIEIAEERLDPNQVIDEYLEAFRKETETNERTEVQTLDCHYAYGDDPRRDAALAANGVPVQHEAVLPPQPWIKLAVYGTSKQVGYDDPANTPPEEIAYFDELQRYTAGLVGDRYAITRALPRNMEISAGGCDKGSAARRLADTLGRSILVCVGDAPNDLAMLQAADYGFRTGDCDPAMRRYDFRDAAPSAEGSVASVIDALRALL